MELFFREFGNGYPLVILHGLYGSSDNWTGIARDLSDRFRVIIPDQRNHGQSPHNPVHTYDALSEDLLELVNKFGINKFVLAGHSMGGKTAIRFSRRWPDRVEGLIVVDMSPFKSMADDNPSYRFHSKILRVMNSADLEGYKTRGDAEMIFNDVTDSSRIRKFLLKNLTRTKSGKFRWKINPAILKANMDNILDGLDQGDNDILPTTGFPVKFLRAEKSDYITDRDIPGILRVFPSADIETVAGTSHWLHAEKPAVFINSVRELIGS